VLDGRNLSKVYKDRGRMLSRRRPPLVAVESVSLNLAGGQTIGIVGESGCGKSTLGRMLAGLLPPTSGQVALRGEELGPSLSRAREPRWREIQLIFQDPNGSLDPRMRVGDLVQEGLEPAGVEKEERKVRVAEMLARVGLDEGYFERYPYELSGGQRQRVAIARALVVRPSVLVGDEPVSALDVSVQGQVLNLLAQLQREMGLAYVLISHNVAVVSYMSDWVLVMYLGRIVERATATQLRGRPLHPYTVALLSAVPDTRSGISPERVVLRGELPDPRNPPTGCRFRTRCPIARSACEEEPPLVEAEPGHWAACHFPGELATSHNGSLTNTNGIDDVGGIEP
jgi:oligopeptide/dipeptide ABC transporter ATP-binding protein